MTETLSGRSARGDRAAFEALLALHGRTLQAVARAHAQGASRAQRACEAEDILQEAVLRAWRGIARLERPARFLPWACAIVQNVASDRARRAQLRRGRPLDEIADPEVAERRPSEVARLRLLAAIERLPAPLREVIELAYFAELTYREISGAIGVSVTTVNLRLGEARAALRAIMEDEDDE